MKTKHIQIPTVWARRPRTVRDTPISERENLLRALNHEKPMWMPNLYSAVQVAPPMCTGELPETMFADGEDWFGMKYIFTAGVGSSTPVEGNYSDIETLIAQIKWPNLAAWDWEKGKDTFVRDENLALSLAWGNGIFERFHGLLGFEQALVDMMLETEACRDFMEQIATFKIEVFRNVGKVYDFDFVTWFDDWGTANSTFFSSKLLENTILHPTRRAIAFVKSCGVKTFFHSCGLINDFIPYYVHDVGADALEIQRINDVAGIVKQYGNLTTVEYRPDPLFMYDPETTEEQARACAREVVDTLGAHVNPGAGIVLSPIALRDEVYYAFDDEVYRYSLEKYQTHSGRAYSTHSFRAIRLF